MKKMIIFLSLMAVAPFLFIGCSKKMAPTTQETQPLPAQQLEAEKPMDWKQSLYPQLAMGDPIVFLNSKEIVMDGRFQNHTFFLQDGAVYRIDSILNVTKTVPIHTTGILTSMKKGSNNQIQEMNILFSQSDRTYEFNFRLKNDGTFTLNGNAKLFYGGKEYNIVVTTKGGECILVFNFFIKKEVENINEQAEGQSVSGTKVIRK